MTAMVMAGSWDMPKTFRGAAANIIRKCHFWLNMHVITEDDLMQEAFLVFHKVKEKRPDWEPKRLMPYFQFAFTNHIRGMARRPKREREGGYDETLNFDDVVQQADESGDIRGLDQLLVELRGSLSAEDRESFDLLFSEEGVKRLYSPLRRRQKRTVGKFRVRDSRDNRVNEIVGRNQFASVLRQAITDLDFDKTSQEGVKMKQQDFLNALKGAEGAPARIESLSDLRKCALMYCSGLDDEQYEALPSDLQSWSNDVALAVNNSTATADEYVATSECPNLPYGLEDGIAYPIELRSDEETSAEPESEEDTNADSVEDDTDNAVVEESAAPTSPPPPPPKTRSADSGAEKYPYVVAGGQCKRMQVDSLLFEAVAHGHRDPNTMLAYLREENDGSLDESRANRVAIAAALRNYRKVLCALVNAKKLDIGTVEGFDRG